jgi:hypothetical protein
MLTLYIGLHVEYLLFLSDFNETNIFEGFSENNQISNFKKIRPAEAESFHADGRTDRHETNSRLSRFCESAYKFRWL